MMVPGGSAARLRQRFRDQFTPLGGGWIYRRASRGAALPVSAPDVEAFVAAFDRALRRLFWGGIGCGMILGIVLGATEGRWPAALAPHAFWILAVPNLLIWGTMFWLAWDAPHRALAGRAPMAPALGGHEVRRQNMRTLPWGALLLGMLISAAMIVPEVTGWRAPQGRGYLVLGIAFLLFFVAMTAAKLRAR